MLLLTRLIIAAFAASACALAGIELRYRFDPTTLILEQDPVALAERLAADAQWAEAKMLADFVIANPALGDAQRAAVLSERMEEELNTFWGKVRRFSRGAITGEPTDTASMLGSLSLDLFVIGDIRDLAVQGWREINDGDGDKIILALSAIGLATTLAPEIDWAPAMAKAFKRSGALSKNFMRNLGDLARQSSKTGDYSKPSKVIDNLGGAAKNLGPGPLKGTMRYVDSTDDLARLARASAIDATGTYGVVKMFGRDGLRRIARDGSNIGTLVAGIKIGSRGIKLTRKATHAVPTPGLLIWLLVSLLVLYMTIMPRHRRRPQRSKPTPSPAKPDRREPHLGPLPPANETMDTIEDLEPLSLPERRPEPELSAIELRSR